MGWFSSSAAEKKYGRNWAVVSRFIELLPSLNYDDWEIVEEMAMTVALGELGFPGTRDEALTGSVVKLNSLAERALIPLAPRIKPGQEASGATWKVVFDQAKAGRWGPETYQNRGTLTALAITVLVGGDLLRDDVVRLFYSPFDRVIPSSALKGSGPRTGIEYIQYGPNWADVVTLLQRLRQLTKQEWQSLPGPTPGADDASMRATAAAQTADRYDDMVRADTATLLAAALADADLRSGPRSAPGIIAARQAIGALVVEDVLAKADLQMLCRPLSALGTFEDAFWG